MQEESVCFKFVGTLDTRDYSLRCARAFSSHGQAERCVLMIGYNALTNTAMGGHKEFDDRIREGRLLRLQCSRGTLVGKDCNGELRCRRWIRGIGMAIASSRLGHEDETKLRFDFVQELSEDSEA